MPRVTLREWVYMLETTTYWQHKIVMLLTLGNQRPSALHYSNLRDEFCKNEVYKPAGALDVKEFTVICGLPPAKASVVRIRRVLAPSRWLVFMLLHISQFPQRERTYLGRRSGPPNCRGVVDLND